MGIKSLIIIIAVWVFMIIGIIFDITFITMPIQLGLVLLEILNFYIDEAKYYEKKYLEESKKNWELGYEMIELKFNLKKESE